MLEPERLLLEARNQDDLYEPLAGAVILAGVAGSSDMVGGSCPGFVVVSEKAIAEIMPRVREVALDLVGGEQEVVVQYVRASI